MGNCLIRRRRIASGGESNILTPGESYSFGGYDWICAELFEDYAVLQSKGVTNGRWPGYIMDGPTTGTGDWGGVNKYYYGDIDGEDVSGYNSTMSDLYSVIGSTEYGNSSYGKGLYLIDAEMAGLPPGSTSSKAMAELDLTGSKLYYHSALVDSALLNDNYSWTGTNCGNSNMCWAMAKNGTISYGNYQTINFCIAPAFNVDLSKINVSSENVITVK